ncbi:hypothetical protein BH11PAT1_BH11PAT1_5460 [soil metagenome]
MELKGEVHFNKVPTSSSSTEVDRDDAQLIPIVVVNSGKRESLFNPLSYIRRRQEEKKINLTRKFLAEESNILDCEKSPEEKISVISVEKNEKDQLDNPLSRIFNKREKKRRAQESVAKIVFYLGLLDIFSRSAVEYGTTQARKNLSVNKEEQTAITERARILLEEIYFKKNDQGVKLMQGEKEYEQVDQILGRLDSQIGILKRETLENPSKFTEKEIKQVEKRAIRGLDGMEDIQKERLLDYSGFTKEHRDSIGKRIKKSSMLTLFVEGPKEPIGILGGILAVSFFRNNIPEVSPFVSTMLGNIFYYVPLLPMMVQNIRLIEKTGSGPNVFAVTANELTKGSKNTKRAAMVAAHVGFEGVKDLATNVIPFLPIPEASAFFITATGIIGMLHLLQAAATEAVLRKKKNND